MTNQKKRLRLTKQMRSKFERVRRLEQIQRLDPIEFEQFVGYLYQKQGFSVSMTATSGDEGVDLFLRKGRRTAVVQCKRYAGTVGQPTVRDLYGAMVHNKANEAVLATSGVISKPAEEWARGKPINLIDGHELMSWSRRVHSRVGPLANIPWFTVGAVIVAAIALGIIVLGLVWGWRTFSSRTASPLQPTPADDIGSNSNLPTRIPATSTTTASTPTSAPAATVTLPATDPDQLTVNRLPNPPQIDGRLDEWQTIPGVKTPFVVASATSWDGSEDLAATWQLAWDADYLYVGVTVVDDRHVQTREPKFAYQGDSLEIQLDTDRSGDFGPAVNGDDYQFILSPGDFKGVAPGSYRFRGNNAGSMADAPGTNIQMAVRQGREGRGYTLEAAVPWSDVAVNPTPGMQMGVALSTNDNDVAGTAVQEVMFSHVSTRKWRDPTSWGTLVLQP